MKKSKPVNVNLGCGTNVVKDFVNIDNFELSQKENKDFIQADIRKIPLEADSVDYIVCDQVLEHLAMADVPVVMYEIRRVLKKGGRCVILVPDFEEAAKMWMGANLNAAFDPLKYHWFSEVIYGNQAHEGEFHKTPMCAGYLHYISNMVGLPKHTISYWPSFGKIPRFPGMRPYNEKATLRNAQLLLDITKT